MRRADAVDADAMWSCVKRKQEPWWLWHAMDHRSGKVVASMFGRRQDEVCLPRTALLEPCGITRYCTDSWGASTRHIDADAHQAGHAQHAEDRTETSDVTHTDHAGDASDALRLHIHTDARHGDWVVCQSL